MRKLYFNYIFGSFILLFTSTLLSCEDENIGDYQLTGNIQNLVPEESYSLKSSISSDQRFYSFLPELDSNFEYWGLKVRQVDYYIDEKIHRSTTVFPYGILIENTDIEKGKHKICAKITIFGEKCEDLILQPSTSFTVWSNEKIERIADFYWDHNYVGHDDVFSITPVLLEGRSPKGTIIDKVEYRLNNSLVATETKKPFTFKYQTVKPSNSFDFIDATVFYHDETHNGLSSSYQTTVQIHDDDDNIVYWDSKSGCSYYKNDEILSLVAKQFKGSENNKEKEIKFYFDNQLIGKSTTFPYTLDYTLSNTSIGPHIILCEITTKEGKALSMSYVERTIEVIE